MPNWCSNTLTVQHSDTDKLKILAQAFDNECLFDAIKPVPEALKNPGTTSFGGSDADAKDQLRKQLLAEYGYSSWYDFCVDQWGTKWEANSYDKADYQDGDTVLQLSFDTAWSPPLGIYQALLSQGYEVEAMYYESGGGYAGVWENGTDDYYDISGMTSQEVASALPSELDDCFNISESMADWEAENEDSEELRHWVEEGVEKLGLDKDSAKK